VNSTSELLIATNNRGKAHEYRELLKGIPFRLVTPAEKGITTEVDETGATLEENARLKAVSFASQSGLLALADDSGLEVDALGGEPGPMSARYAGEGVSDEQRVQFLLSKLSGIPLDKRTARFRCVIAIAMPRGEVITVEGECRGYITLEPKGKHGFGYDPIFFVPEFNRTMAELTTEEKNPISHRGRAAEKARISLENIKPRTS
jgi:XTP/dITP diphosphohydrolase